MARRPVPADGSSTTSAGVIAAARGAARPSGIGVENCWSASLSSERRVWVGRRLAIFASMRQRGGRRAGLAEERLAVFAQEQDGRRFAGVVGRFPVPSARGVGGAEGRLHGGAQDAGIDRPAAFEMGEKELGRREDVAGDAEGRDGRRRRSRQGRGRGQVVHEGDLGERERDEPIGALSRTASAQTRPGRPLTLFATST